MRLPNKLDIWIVFALIALAALLVASIARAAPPPECVQYAGIYRAAAQDRDHGRALREQVAVVKVQVKTPEQRALYLDMLANVYDRPTVSPDAWFGFALATCEIALKAKPEMVAPQ